MAKNKKLVFFFLLLAFASVAADAKNYKITSHEINVDVDLEGYASVKERYYLVFDDKESAEAFQSLKNNDLKFDLEKWKAFDPNLKINFGLESNLSELLIEFADEPSGERLYYTEFKYSFNTPAFNKSTKQEIGRKISFSINKSFVRQLTRGTDFVIPEWTTIRFIFPPQSEPDGPLVLETTNPKIRISHDIQSKRKTMELRGYFASNDFALGFYYYKAIAPSFSIAMLVKELSEKTPKETLIIAGFIIAIVGIFLFAIRKKIEDRLSGFIIKHSNVSQDEEERK
ncbi:MAG: hypothetical protein QXK06_04045 [Candidatus Diapherotrites archaeon]